MSMPDAKVVADLYRCPSFRISRFADFARAHFSVTHVQWFYALHWWRSVFAAEIRGCLKKGVAMSGRKCFRVHVLGRFRLLAGDTPIIIPPRLRKPQELL